MSLNFPLAPLDDLKAPGRYSMVGGPFGSKLVSADYVTEGVPVIRGVNLPVDQRFTFDHLVFVTETKARRDLFGNIARPGDIVVTQRGTVGQVGLVPRASPYPQFVVSQSQMKLTVDPLKADVRFVYYALKSPMGQHEIASKAISAGVPHINLGLFQQVRIPLPPRDLQAKIATILSAYDDLIENNNRRIHLLEEMANRIYREWFVDFRFPGQAGGTLVPSELGPMPDGWNVSALSSLARLTMGQSPPSRAYNTHGLGLPFHQGVGSYGDNFPIHNVYSSTGTRVAEAGDILVSVRAPVGRINVADRRLILGRGLCAIRPAEAPRGFLWQALKHFFREEDILGGGSIFQSVTKRDMEGLRLPWPGRTLAEKFSDIAEPIWDQLHSLTSQVSNLRSTREILLPKLISGVIDVTELDIAMPPAAA